jgi:hypothetical protein
MGQSSCELCWPVAGRGRSHPRPNTIPKDLFFLVLFTFGVDYVSKHALLVSFAEFFNFATWLPSLNLAAKFELGSQVGSQVQTWQTSRKELVEILLRPKNLAA